jgi:uracil phosphoribosyltransferase
MNNPNIIVCQHPLLHHNLSTVRNKNSNRELFRLAVRRVTQFILHEATEDLLLTKSVIETPIARVETQILATDTPIIITPVLRAGLAMAEVLMDLIPSASVYHLGLYRDEKTLQPITYYNKLSGNLDYKNSRVFILDPMLATGGSVLAALKIVKSCGVSEENITLACVIAAPEGIEAVTKSYPHIKIFTGAIDECLNENAYIVPGLGDAGDRVFGT